MPKNMWQSSIGYDVGDLVKDIRNRIFIVVSMRYTSEDVVYAVYVSQISGRPSSIDKDDNGLIAMFPTDLRKA